MMLMMQMVAMAKTYQQPVGECDEWRQEERAPTGRRRSSQSDCGVMEATKKIGKI